MARLFKLPAFTIFMSAPGIFHFRGLTIGWLLLVAVGLQADVPYWNWRNPFPHGNDFEAAAYGEGRFVAVARGGTIVTSTDGVNWKQAYAPVRKNWWNVVYGAGKFIARTYPPDVLLVSEDGEWWEEMTPIVPPDWQKISSMTFAAGKFWAMSNNLGFVATSEDGVTWTQHAVASAVNATRIAEGDGILMATDSSTGRLGSPDGVNWPVSPVKMLTSTDGGDSWQTQQTTEMATIAAGPVFIEGQWLFGGTYIVDRSGQTVFYQATAKSADHGATWRVEWTNLSPWSGNAPIYDFELFQDRAFLVGIQSTLIGSTTDGVMMRPDWQDLSGGQPLQINGLQAGGDRLVAFGRFGNLFSSADGQTWDSASRSPVHGNFRAAAFGDGYWVVTGDTGLARSSDGREWTMVAGTTGDSQSSGVAYGNGRFVASGTNYRINVSTDAGATWTHNPDFEASLRHVRFGGGKFVGLVAPKGSAEQLYVSTDGVEWTEASGVDGFGWSRIEFVQGQFYAVGGPSSDDTGAIARSFDGLNWEIVATASSPVYAIAGSSRLLLATTLYGEVMASTFGLDWEVRSKNAVSLESFGPTASLEYVGDQFVGVTYYGRVIVSTDGWSWESEDFSGSGMVFELEQGNGQLLAVGNGGLIWESGTARFTNNSARTQVGSGDDILVSGFVINGEMRQRLLLRAAGPALTDLGVTGALARPVLRIVRSGGAEVNQNAGWWRRDNAGEIAAAAALAGAFPFAENSEDAALLLDLDPGAYTAVVSGVDGETGVGLVEIYAIDGDQSRLVNISTRSRVGTGDELLITGFVVSGDVPQRILVRGIGPALTGFGVEGAVAKPSLKVLRGMTELFANEGWGTASNADEIREVSAQMGAFALPEGSADSALLVTLPPGVYTVQIAGADGTTGVALAEVYEVR